MNRAPVRQPTSTWLPHLQHITRHNTGRRAFSASRSLAWYDVAVNDKRVLPFLKKHNISPPTSTINLGVKFPEYRAPGINAFYSRQHCYDGQADKIFSSVDHPGTLHIFERLLEAKAKPFWYEAVFAGGANAVVASKAKRWLRRGLRLGLEAHGYDRDGRKVVREGEQSEIKDLYGTLKVGCHDAQKLCQMKFPDVQIAMERVIAAAVLQLRRNHEGQHISPPAPRFTRNPYATKSFNTASPGPKKVFRAKAGG